MADIVLQNNTNKIIGSSGFVNIGNGYEITFPCTYLDQFQALVWRALENTSSYSAKDAVLRIINDSTTSNTFSGYVTIKYTK